MTRLSLYQWLIGTKNEFTNPFRDNEYLYKQAQIFWQDLDLPLWIYVLVVFLIAFFGMLIYYKPINNRPQRRYRPRIWLWWLFITAIFAFFISIVFSSCLLAEPSTTLKGSWGLIIKIAFCDFLYTGIAYFLLSFIFCNISHFKTNAYKYLKIGK